MASRHGCLARLPEARRPRRCQPPGCHRASRACPAHALALRSVFIEFPVAILVETLDHFFAIESGALAARSRAARVAAVARPAWRSSSASGRDRRPSRSAGVAGMQAGRSRSAGAGRATAVRPGRRRPPLAGAVWRAFGFGGSWDLSSLAMMAPPRSFSSSVEGRGEQHLFALLQARR